LITILALAGAVLAAGPGRAGEYEALLADGSRVSGTDLNPWHHEKAQPRLSGKNLFDGENPPRWLKNHSLGDPGMPESFIEFFGGDRLPGRAVLHRSGTEFPYRRDLPHLLVETDVPLGRPGDPSGKTIRVATRWIRRVVWNGIGTDRYWPGTILHRDGRKMEYRSLRWKGSSLRLLQEEGITEVPFGDIAELHLPRQDPWEVYFQELSALCPGGSGFLVQLETAGGLLATTARSRLRVDSPVARAGQGHHILQPAWSLDPLWIPEPSIRIRRYFLPHRVPLVRIEPSRVHRQSFLGESWFPRINRNVAGGALTAGGVEFGWGLGVQALCEAEYELPSCARSFRTLYGLDGTVGRGGCARARITSGDGKTLHESRLLVGSTGVSDTGPISVAGLSRLVLVADPAHRDRPPLADPFDIRDRLDWIEPEIELDPRLLRAELQKRASRWIPAWDGWEVEGSDAPFLLENRRDLTDHQKMGFRQEVLPCLPFLKLTRSLRIAPDQNWLLISANRLAGQSDRARIQVRIGRESAGVYEVPQHRSGSGTNPIMVPLDAHHGQETTIDLLQLRDGSQALVSWQAIEITELPPGIIRIFEDEPRVVARLRRDPQGAAGPPDGDAPPERASLESGDVHSGKSSLKITGGRWHLELTGLQVPVSGKSGVGEFRFLRFAWKKPGGGQIALGLDRMVREEPGDRENRPSLRYQAGGDPPGGMKGFQIGAEAPRTWQVVTRDLYEDFGSCYITGFSFSSRGGDSALFDHVYLGQTTGKLDEIRKSREGKP